LREVRHHRGVEVDQPLALGEGGGGRREALAETTCAIVGGVIAAGKAGVPPAEWADRVEPLPGWVRTSV
ncbi:hypothetical protein ACWEGV_27585, partial [Streptomyces sp. NPDC004976]